MLEAISKYLYEVITISTHLKKEDICGIAELVIKIREDKGRIFFAGVGGSAANCSHAVNDFRKILKIESYAITDNVSELTARINDDGWGTSFSKWLEISNINEKDGLFVLSVGGGSATVSQNIVGAIDLAIAKNAKVMSIVSRDGGYAKEKSDACVMIPVISEDRITPHAEEWQAILWHLLVNVIGSNT